LPSQGQVNVSTYTKKKQWVSLLVTSSHD
jgi:hypothetical protein